MAPSDLLRHAVTLDNGGAALGAHVVLKRVNRFPGELIAAVAVMVIMMMMMAVMCTMMMVTMMMMRTVLMVMLRACAHMHLVREAWCGERNPARHQQRNDHSSHDAVSFARWPARSKAATAGFRITPKSGLCLTRLKRPMDPSESRACQTESPANPGRDFRRLAIQRR
jgi:hypothetical protein